MKKLCVLSVFFIIFLLIGQNVFGQEGTPAVAADNTGRVYNIGDTGPAGGIIFFDKGAFTDGWRYLEAAPIMTEITAQWGTQGKNVAGTETTVGSGRHNTQLIVEHINNTRKPERGRAAQICADLIYGGYDDWFLPSRDELFLMFNILKQRGLGDFTNNWYWSSSQNARGDAFSQDFNGGGQFTRRKSDVYRVRAIRAF